VARFSVAVSPAFVTAAGRALVADGPTILLPCVKGGALVCGLCCEEWDIWNVLDDTYGQWGTDFTPVLILADAYHLEVVIACHTTSSWQVLSLEKRTKEQTDTPTIHHWKGLPSSLAQSAVCCLQRNDGSYFLGTTDGRVIKFSDGHHQCIYEGTGAITSLVHSGAIVGVLVALDHALLLSQESVSRWRPIQQMNNVKHLGIVGSENMPSQTRFAILTSNTDDASSILRFLDASGHISTKETTKCKALLKLSRSLEAAVSEGQHAVQDAVNRISLKRHMIQNANVVACDILQQKRVRTANGNIRGVDSLGCVAQDKLEFVVIGNPHTTEERTGGSTESQKDVVTIKDVNEWVAHGRWGVRARVESSGCRINAWLVVACSSGVCTERTQIEKGAIKDVCISFSLEVSQPCLHPLFHCICCAYKPYHEIVYDSVPFN